MRMFNCTPHHRMPKPSTRTPTIEMFYRDGYDSRKLSEGFSGYFSVHQDERLGGNVAYKTPKGSGEKPPPFAGTPLLTEAMDR